MKKKISIIVIIIIALCITCICIFTFLYFKNKDKGVFIPSYDPHKNEVTNNINTNIKEETPIYGSVDKVTIEILNDTITRNSVDILVTDLNETQFGWGDEFWIQKKNNGVWEYVPFKDPDCIRTFVTLYHLDENHQTRMHIDFTKDYGTLENGFYRIVKRVYTNQFVYLYSNEFEIR